VFRTSDAFLFEKIVLCGITGTPPHREIEKTALGATSSVKWDYFADTMEAVVQLRNSGYNIVSVEQAVGSIPLKKLKIDTKKISVIFGHEVKGVARKLLTIPDLS
jgi:tRNA G18 (ribose-2'-O)-methylase SpoU